MRINLIVGLKNFNLNLILTCFTHIHCTLGLWYLRDKVQDCGTKQNPCDRKNKSQIFVVLSIMNKLEEHGHLGIEFVSPFVYTALIKLSCV